MKYNVVKLKSNEKLGVIMIKSKKVNINGFDFYKRLNNVWLEDDTHIAVNDDEFDVIGEIEDDIDD